MTITINQSISRTDPGPLAAVSDLVDPSVNSVQKGFMQSMAQLFSVLSQLFSSGAQNSQFNATPLSTKLGDTISAVSKSLGSTQPAQIGGNSVTIAMDRGQLEHRHLMDGQGRSMSAENILNIKLGDGLGKSNILDLGKSSNILDLDLGKDVTAPPIMTPMNMDRAAQILNRNFDNVSGGKETVGRDELTRALTDPTSSPEMKRAARFLLDNPDAFRKLETADQRAAGGGGCSMRAADGLISKGDTVACMAKSDTPASQRERIAIAELLANKDLFMSGGDKAISKDELAYISATGKLPNGQPAPESLRSAARFFTQNPEAFAKLEDTSFYRNPDNKNIPKGDGKVGLQDMLLALS